ncbi:hypothetical protein [Streptomyces flaveus]|uniref:hypothetical protein n=1 Tax=Streptomyces flaveus TaxID=66370 RepID=UPI00331FEC80
MEFSDEKLLELGCTATDASSLINSMRKLKSGTNQAAAVRFTADPDLSSSGTPIMGKIDSSGIVDVILPERTHTLWEKLFKHALSAMSPRELFLRTGYEYEDLERAVAAFSFRAGDHDRRT